MRRALVLTDDRRRHPFLASLPPHACAAESGDDTVDPAQLYWRKRLTRRDWRDIFATYCSTFVAVSIFMA